MGEIIREIQPHRIAINPYLSIRDGADYDRAVEQMNTLVDIAGTDEDHLMYEYLTMPSLSSSSTHEN